MSCKNICIFTIFNAVKIFAYSQYLTLSLFNRKSPSNACLPGTNCYTFPVHKGYRPFLQPVSKKVVSNSQCIHALACVSLTNLLDSQRRDFFFFPEQKTDRCFPLPNTRTMLLFFFLRTCGIFLWDLTSLGGR